MKTMLDIDDDLFARAMAKAKRDQITINEIVEEGLRRSLERDATLTEQIRTELPSFGEGGLRPGVSLENKAQIQDILDGIE